MSDTQTQTSSEGTPANLELNAAKGILFDPAATVQVAFDPDKMAASLELCFQPCDHLASSCSSKENDVTKDEQPAITIQSEEPQVVSTQVGANKETPHMMNGIVIDWIDAKVNVKVQILRWKDYKIYDLANNTFKDEVNVYSFGLIPLERPFTGLRGDYQVLELLTPEDPFTNGIYRIFYYDDNNVLLDVASFGVWNGSPFYEYGVPHSSLPTVSELGAEITSTLFNADTTQYKDPRSFGALVRKILANSGPVVT